MKKNFDWTCDEISLHGLRKSDRIQTVEARRERFEELQGLLRLPFHSGAQVIRIGALRGIRQHDNRTAHAEAIAWRDRKSV